jgi:hypothetical protein
MTDTNLLSTTLEQLRAAAASGTLVDLSGLMPEIERLCAEARASADARTAAAELQRVTKALDALHAELSRVEEVTRRNAMEAYSR